MNIEVIKSWIFKLLPIVTAYLIGKNIIGQDTADKLIPIIDAVIMLIVTVPTLIRSIKTHKEAKKEATP